MPHVLDLYQRCSQQRLSELADHIGVCEDNDRDNVKAGKFIQAVRDLNKRLDIPDEFAQLSPDDFDKLSKDAVNESVQYPVPRLISLLEINSILAQITKKGDQ